jgi:hypothetical protein
MVKILEHCGLLFSTHLLYYVAFDSLVFMYHFHFTNYSIFCGLGFAQ